MSLIKCYECKAMVSNEAKACPNCGAEVKQPPGRLKIFIVGLLCIFIVKGFWDSNSGSGSATLQKSPEELAAAERKEARFQSVVSRIRALRDSTKNPASFEIVRVTNVDGDVVCITYRGTNTFNAVVTEQKAIRHTLEVGNWSNECAGKTGVDFDNVRYAL